MNAQTPPEGGAGDNHPQVTAAPRQPNVRPGRLPTPPGATAERLVETLGADGARDWWREVGVELDRQGVER